MYDGPGALLFDFLVRPLGFLRFYPLEKELRSIKNRKTLEVGIGTGIMAEYLIERGFDVTGIDSNEQMLRIARDHLSKKTVLVHGKGEDLPFDPLTFDLVIFSYSFHHARTPIKFIKEAYRVLKKGGKVIILDVYPPIVGSTPQTAMEGLAITGFINISFRRDFTSFIVTGKKL